MIKKAKALIGFPEMKDDELMVTAVTILAAMNENVNFENPDPELDEVQADLEDFMEKLAQSRKRGSPEDTALKNESKANLAETLQRLGYYVNSTARGHLPTVLSSGFPTNTPRVLHQIPLQIEGVKLMDGRQSGQVLLYFTKQQQARVYEYCYRKAGDVEEEWSDRLTTTSSRGNVIAPLEVAQRYEVKVRAINSKGVGDWSEIASIIVR